MEKHEDEISSGSVFWVIKRETNDMSKAGIVCSIGDGNQGAALGKPLAWTTKGGAERYARDHVKEKCFVTPMSAEDITQSSLIMGGEGLILIEPGEGPIDVFLTELFGEQKKR